ncbi:putative Signal peptide peptidase [Leptomonas seymouri]|uniref:Putative Signal peptide peptidase n=1 Tax=Leptomonas seymouri TaxID=5684 RepID=A0A0N1I7Y2_LEPSE|nr:putative Signal peptide peptidase [Leptomonas seymouri]|eukprot:KPI89821.1 putative Signal peptide peptidase [Leptomonas seymouri]
MYEFYISLGFLVSCAVSVVAVAALRSRKAMMHGEVEITLQIDEALSMPLNGSVVLFSAYVLLRFIPKEYFNVVTSLYLSVVGIFALNEFVKGYMKANILTGFFCVGTGAISFVTGNWIANNVLAFAIGVTALEYFPSSSFSSSFILLIGLFFYDIFWVFGSDVMLTVATGIDGPIKMLFPRNIFGDHESKSLLGLGDIIVPGLFICQTLIFSKDCVKRGNLYFITALVAYTLSLINTMAVMVIFQHGQPALLFIVPWLLISFCAVAIYQGDLHAAWDFDAFTVFPPTMDETSGNGEASNDKNESAWSFVRKCALDLFGLVPEEVKSDAGGAKLKEKKEA